jgi:hypothetical protein
MRFAALLPVLLATVVGGCRRADSYLLVEVAGDLSLMPAQFQVAVDCRKPMLSRVFNIPEAPTAITLPASFSIELDRNIIGPVVVYVAAVDVNGGLLGSGQTRQEHIKVGDDTIISVWLRPPDGGDPDGGTGDPDAGSFDAGDPDAGDPDAGVADAGDPDATAMDAEDQ